MKPTYNQLEQQIDAMAKGLADKHAAIMGLNAQLESLQKSFNDLAIQLSDANGRAVELANQILTATDAERIRCAEFVNGVVIAANPSVDVSIFAIMVGSGCNTTEEFYKLRPDLDVGSEKVNSGLVPLKKV